MDPETLLYAPKVLLYQVGEGMESRAALGAALHAGLPPRTTHRLRAGRRW